MSRELTAGVEAEIASRVVRPALLVKITTMGGDANFWTGLGDLVWGSDTYAGAGKLGGISEVSETLNLQANGIQFNLSGVSVEILRIALAEIKQGLPCWMWLAFLDSSMNIIADPVHLWEGFTDVPEISEMGSSATVGLSSESKMVDLERPRTRRYTDQDQRFDSATDKGFEFVPSLQDKQIMFG